MLERVTEKNGNRNCNSLATVTVHIWNYEVLYGIYQRLTISNPETIGYVDETDCHTVLSRRRLEHRLVSRTSTKTVCNAGEHNGEGNKVADRANTRLGKSKRLREGIP